MRYPAVSGLFYPSSKSALSKSIGELLEFGGKNAQKAEGAVALVCPHAGYIYSGKTAAVGFESCREQICRKGITIVIIGPNHTGAGRYPIGISTEKWQTPLGVCGPDAVFSAALQKESPFIKVDEAAHASEHSVEVMLPFLQGMNPSAKYVFVCMSEQSIEAAQILGKAIFAAEEKTEKEIFVLASSDFTHYESAQSARMKDMHAIGILEEGKTKEFEGIVQEKRLSICGHSPIAAAQAYAKCCGAKKTKLLHYSNSGEASGDFASVVAYAAIAFCK
ncbi:Memo-like protein [Candidatus Anstonella stagnisolia]|nr:Memo-like protein [Candidatus Anstonella stagnisolia]